MYARHRAGRRPERESPPITVIAIPVAGRLSSRWRLPPSSDVASAGMKSLKCAMRVVIVSGPATSVKSPTARSRTAGIAKNVEYASADASIVPLFFAKLLTARDEDPLPLAGREAANARVAEPRLRVKRRLVRHGPIAHGEETTGARFELRNRGGEIRTRELLRPKRSTLTRLSYAPSFVVRATAGTPV